MTGMTFEQWWETFKPIKNPFDPDRGGPYIADPDDYEPGGQLFEVSGDEMEYVRKIAETEPGRVWTLLDADGVQVIGNGLHFVNRQGYYVTEVAFNGEFLDIVVDEDDLTSDHEDEDDEQCDDDHRPPSTMKP